MLSTLLITGLLWIVFRTYLYTARRWNIFDIPNFRSSHDQITVRGAGILFPIAWILFSAVNGFFLPYFTTGLFLIALISFLDDIKSRTIAVRVGFHLLAIALAIVELYQGQSFPWFTAPLLVAGFFVTINMVNFMDGINGMLGIQSLVFLLSLMVYKNRQEDLDFMLSPQSPFPYLFASLIVFGYYNFRRKALVFSGDVGSISAAFIMAFVITCTVMDMSLVTPSTFIADDNNGYVFDGFDLRYLLLLGVFYVDAGVTILHRLIKGEKITASHRKHLYQFLVNELQWPHLVVSTLYGVVQLGLSLMIILYKPDNDGTVVIGGLLLVLYVTLRLRVIQEINRLEAIRTVSDSGSPKPKSQPGTDKAVLAQAKTAAPLLPLDSVYNHDHSDLRPLDSAGNETSDRELVEQASIRRKTLKKLSSRTSLRSTMLHFRKGD